MSKLFTPLKRREITFRNRIFVSPMCQYSSVDGMPNDWHLVHLGSRAAGGAGLVIVEASAVSPIGRISPDDSGIWSSEHAQAFKRIVDFMHQEGAATGIQLAHAGRKAGTSAPWLGHDVVPLENGGWIPIAPSPIAFDKDYFTPREMTKSDIDEVTRQFIASARYADQAGFDVVEIHMAHGYLLNEFLSPLTNKRSDEFGGSIENRMRFPLQVAREVRKVWPQHKPLFVRISATDWVDGGWTIDDSVLFSRELKKMGTDLIDCSSGGVVPHAKIPVGAGYQVPLAAAVRRDAEIATGAVGLITKARQAEEIIATGSADVVLIAREMLRDPYWPLHAAHELGVDVPWPKQYERAKPH